MSIAFEIPSGLTPYVRSTVDSFEFSATPLSWRHLLRAHGWRIHGTVLRQTGMWGAVVPTAGRAVYLEGTPGRQTGLRIGATPLLTSYPSSDPTRAWTPNHMEWLARIVARLLDRPLDRSRWDEKAWQVWLADPRLRGRLALEERVRVSRKNHPAPFRYALEEPPGDVQLDAALYRLGGQRVPSQLVRLTRDEVRLAHWTVPYGSIDAAAALWKGRDARLLIACDEHVYTVVQLTRAAPLDFAHLGWLARELNRRASRVRPTEDDESLVPESLRHLTLRHGP